MITSIVNNTLVSTITTTSSGKMSADATTLTSNIISLTTLVRLVPCCKVDSTFTLSDSTCPTMSNSTQQNSNTCCKALIRAYINAYYNAIVYISLGILAFFVS
ncbi:unnamed protein product [Heterobilharzia americana]|nr:unnamed protein product [Heterobilharzia americana]